MEKSLKRREQGFRERNALPAAQALERLDRLRGSREAGPPARTKR